MGGRGAGPLIPAPLRLQLLEGGHPLLQRRVRGEELHQGVSREGGDDEEGVCALYFLFLLGGDVVHPPADLLERRYQRPGILRQFGAAPVRRELPVAGERAGEQGAQDPDEDRDDVDQDQRAHVVVAVAAATAEESHEKPVAHDQEGEHRYETRHRQGQHVPVLHVRHLVGEHRFEFLAVERPHDRVGDRHDGVLRAAPGRERVRNRGGHDPDPRFREARSRGEALDHAVQLRVLVLFDDPGAGAPEHQLIGEEELEERHPGGHQQEELKGESQGRKDAQEDQVDYEEQE